MEYKKIENVTHCLMYLYIILKNQLKIMMQGDELEYGMKTDNLFLTRYFYECSLKSSDKILLSNYLLPGTLEIVSKLNLPESSHILCITYDKKIAIDDRTGDTQLFISGKANGDENITNTLKREIKEGTTLEVIDDSKITFLGNDMKRGINVEWYLCPVENTIPGDYGKKIWNTNQHNIKRKISCIIWGSKEEIINKMTQIKKNKQIIETGIAGVSTISFNHVKQIIKMLQNERFPSFSKFFWTTNQEYLFAFSGRRIVNDEMYNYIINLIL